METMVNDMLRTASQFRSLGEVMEGSWLVGVGEGVEQAAVRFAVGGGSSCEERGRSEIDGILGGEE